MPSPCPTLSMSISLLLLRLKGSSTTSILIFTTAASTIRKCNSRFILLCRYCGFHSHIIFGFVFASLYLPDSLKMCMEIGRRRSSGWTMAGTIVHHIETMDGKSARLRVSLLSVVSWCILLNSFYFGFCQVRKWINAKQSHHRDTACRWRQRRDL